MASMSASVRLRGGVLGLLGDRGHAVPPGLWFRWACGGRCGGPSGDGVVDVAGAGGGADAGLDGDAARVGLPGWATVIAPLRRSRTAPERIGRTQPMQMPMGTRWASARPRTRRRRGSGWPVGLDDHGAGAEGDGAAVAGLDGRGAEALGGQHEPAFGVVLLEGVEEPAGPQAYASRSSRSGPGRPGRRRRACRGRRRSARRGGCGPARRGGSSAAKIEAGSVALTWTSRCRCSWWARRAENRLRSMPITGVMPNPR